jgi:hypothetical protein
MVIAFVVWTIVAFIFFLIGISVWKAREVVGFFTFVKPPVIKNIEQYNHSVALLWVIFSFILELLGVPFLFAEQNSPVFIIVILGVFVLILGMIITYLKIEAKYKKQV